MKTFKKEPFLFSCQIAIKLLIIRVYNDCTWLDYNIISLVWQLTLPVTREYAFNYEYIKSIINILILYIAFNIFITAVALSVTHVADSISGDQQLFGVSRQRTLVFKWTVVDMSAHVLLRLTRVNIIVYI